MTKENRALVLVISSSIVVGIFVWILTSLFEPKILNPYAIITILMSSILSSLATFVLKDSLNSK